MDVEPKNPPPVYAPEVVAEVILHCATHPVRDVFAGAGGKFISAQGYYAPRLTDKFMERFTMKQQRTDEPRHNEHNGLYQPSGELKERGDYPGHVSESSLYTKASLHPVLTAALAVGASLAAAALFKNGQSKRTRFQARTFRRGVGQWLK